MNRRLLVIAILSYFLFSVSTGFAASIEVVPDPYSLSVIYSGVVFEGKYHDWRCSGEPCYFYVTSNSDVDVLGVTLTIDGDGHGFGSISGPYVGAIAMAQHCFNPFYRHELGYFETKHTVQADVYDRDYNIIDSGSAEFDVNVLFSENGFTGTGTGTGTLTNTGTGTNTDTDTNTNTSTDTNTGTETETGTDTETGTGSSTDTGTGSDTGTDTGVDSDTYDDDEIGDSADDEESNESDDPGDPQKQPSPPKPTECPIPPSGEDENYSGQNEDAPEMDPYSSGYDSPPVVDDPVNLVSGNLSHKSIDATLRSRIPLVIGRFYNSQDVRTGPFGRGWSSYLFSRLLFKGSDVVFVNSDGAGTRFRKNGNSYVPVNPLVQLSLSLATDTDMWAVSHPKGSTWYYDSTGKIIRLAKACCGHGASDAIEFSYDENGRLKQISNSCGQSFQFQYDSSGRIAKATDSTGRAVEYSYDVAGNLISFKDPLGRIAFYDYDAAGFLTQIRCPGGKTSSFSYTDRKVSQITDANGHAHRFEWFINPRKVVSIDRSGAIRTYVFDSSSRLTEYIADGNSKKYLASNSVVVGYQDRNGQAYSYSYNAEGLLSSITDPTGAKSEFEYHPTFKKVVKKKDPLGREWRYAWCRRGNLISETDPAGGVISYTYDAYNNRTSRTDQLGRVTKYQYDADGKHLLKVIDPLGGASTFAYDNRGNLTSTSDQLGRVTSFEYDLLNRVTKTIYPDGRFTTVSYDMAGNVAKRTDQIGRETRYTYDFAGHITAITRPDGTVQAMAYDESGRKISETDPLGRVTRFEYDKLGRLTKTIFPDGAVNTMAYDAAGRLISRSNELGQTTSMEYDPLGRLLATIDPTGARWESQYDAAGRKIMDKDPFGRLTSYNLDALDRITKTIRPDNSFTTTSFDAVGNVLNTTDALDKRWSWVYDDLNRQVKAIRPNGATSTTAFDAVGQVISETDPLGRTTNYTYDLGGRRTSTTDALSKVWKSIYDPSGRLVAVKDPLDAVSSMTYDLMDRVVSKSDPLGNLTSFEFDAAGRQIAKTDAMGRRSITAYDLRDRVIREVDPDARSVSYGYNLAGQRVSLTDAANRTWKWDYDALGRVTNEYDPLGHVTRYSYDSVGNRIAWTNARNMTTTYTFDAMNRLTRMSYPDGLIATMGYDLEGRELVRSSSTGSVVKTYDLMGNLISETFGPWGKKWQYSYDMVGNRVQAIDPEGRVFKYKYDALNRMVELDSPAKGDEIKYSFDSVGRLVKEERPGVKTTNTFDLAGRLLELRHERDRGSARLVALRKYTYSPIGNRLTMCDEDNDVTRYYYNGSDWLTKVVYPGGKQVSCRYNSAGDRLEEKLETPTLKKVGRNWVVGTSTVVIPMNYDAGGRLISRASDTFVFDSDGNQVSAVENGEESRYFWSPDNRLLKVEKDILCDRHGKRKCGKCKTKTIAEEYGYLPGDWKRVSRKADGETFVSVFDGDDESHEYQVKNQGRDDHRFGPRCPQPKPKLELVREFIGGPGTDDLEVTKYRGRSLSMLKDALGSTIALTNRGGNAVAKIGYDAWGNLTWPDKPGHGVPPCRELDLGDLLDRLEGKYTFGGPIHDWWHHGRHFAKVLTPYLYAGRRLDAFSDNYNNRNRYMNPKYGRFTSRDPIGFAGDLNLYRYAENNPVSYTDPFGLLAFYRFVKLGLGEGIYRSDFNPCLPNYWLELVVVNTVGGLEQRVVHRVNELFSTPDFMSPQNPDRFEEFLGSIDSFHKKQLGEILRTPGSAGNEAYESLEAYTNQRLGSAYKNYWY